MIIQCLLFAVFVFLQSNKARAENMALVIRFDGVNITFRESSFLYFFRFLCIPERHHCSAFGWSDKLARPTVQYVSEVNISTVLCLGDQDPVGQPVRKCEVYRFNSGRDFAINCTKSERYTQTIRFRNDSHLVNKLCTHGSVKLDWPSYVKVFVNTSLLKVEYETPLPVYSEYVLTTGLDTQRRSTVADTLPGFAVSDTQHTSTVADTLPKSAVSDTQPKSAEADKDFRSAEADTKTAFKEADIQPLEDGNYVIVLTVILSLTAILICIVVIILIQLKKRKRLGLNQSIQGMAS
ncbi:hypothetical protein Btru_054542 [Bulinus truncatus]|nr:hypothetical protein Btru_054542 [Bulinus truncatus]